MTIKFLLSIGIDMIGYYFGILKDFFLNNLILCSAIILIIYGIKTITFYKLANKSCPKKKWMSFIPIIRHFIFFYTINRSCKNILLVLFLMCVPIVGWISMLILYVIWNLELVSKFTDKTVFKIMSIIIHPICLMVLAFNKFRYSKQL